MCGSDFFFKFLFFKKREKGKEKRKKERSSKGEILKKAIDLKMKSGKN